MALRRCCIGTKCLEQAIELHFVARHQRPARLGPELRCPGTQPFRSVGSRINRDGYQKNIFAKMLAQALLESSKCGSQGRTDRAACGVNEIDRDDLLLYKIGIEVAPAAILVDHADIRDRLPVAASFRRTR